jgi:hypothetical protein
MASAIIKAELVLVNAAAFDALRDALGGLRELAEDLPWNDEVKEALANLETAAAGLRVAPSGGEELYAVDADGWSDADVDDFEDEDGDW